MKLSIESSVRLEQQLIMTPEMVQAIKILQMNTVDLGACINEELMSNPLLEINEEIEKEKLYDSLSRRFAGATKVDEVFDQANLIKAEYSLSEILHMQLYMFIGISRKMKSILSYIIDTLDDNGYQTEDKNHIADRLGYNQDYVEKAISIIQSFEPAGVCAENLEECIKLQLIRQNEYNDIFERIIYRHLKDLALNHMGNIAKDCGISIDEAQRCCDIIRSCNPKPGAQYGACNDTMYVVPDCSLDIINGKCIISLNDNGLPKLKVSSYYSSIKDNAAEDEYTCQYLKERLDAALWFLRGIEQRQQTIKKIAEAVVDFQKDFFLKGKVFLKPMTLKDIAEIAGVHESTVSRTVNGKYIQTPKGIFELKYFFCGGMSTDIGESISASVIKDYINEIIKGENEKHPLSDEKITALLNEQYGICIARRTVAKYREQLGIPGTSKRKRF